MVAPSARRSRSINSASLLPSRGAAVGARRPALQTDARFRKKLRLRRLAGLDRVLRSLVDGDRFQPGRRQFKRKSPPGFVATPERRSRFCVDLAGKAKLHELGARFTDSRALHRLGRCQAAVLTLRRRAHHHKLCIGKFDAHDPTLPLIPEARLIRAPHQDEPRIGRSRRSGWVTGASCAPRLTTTQCSTPNEKPVLSAHGRAIVVNEIEQSAGIRLLILAGDGPRL